MLRSLQETFRQWALRGKAPEPVPVVLSRRRVYVLPTRAGLAFSATLLVMFLSAVNYSLSLGHALVFLLVGLGLAAILATFRNLVDLRLRPGHAPPVFAGETARFGLILENPRPQSRFNAYSDERRHRFQSQTRHLFRSQTHHSFRWLPPRIKVYSHRSCPGGGT